MPLNSLICNNACVLSHVQLCNLTRLLCAWDFSCKNTGVGCHFFLQGMILDPRIKSVSPKLSGRFFTIEPPGKPINNEVEGITWMVESWKFEGNYLASFTWNLGKVNSKQPLCIEIDLTISRKIQEYMGFPGGTSGKEPTCQCRRCKRCEFDSWARKIPWRRAWQPTLVFLPGESHG